MEGPSTFNVTMYALQTVSNAYIYCYDHLRRSNIVLPPPERVFAVVSQTAQYILNHSPAVLRQVYAAAAAIPIQANFIGMLVMLFVTYVIYCVLLSMFRSMYRFFLGFLRFSFIVGALATVVYLAQIYLLPNSDQEPSFYSNIKKRKV
ncbi:uncharacterized protein BYT42DRAFT_590370 [Radiomyces spectabilis]|uniref:uncharacterized protein n=1 Tax=Radiomyces spectabilis TaxID=64574 RepID=UPI002220BEA8|nr:uncharacterized protein BYT42DRAFT_590370 [Radiomyces spectabilis]KAI8364765.1 hypothetical protein BYT42DRAFT_590370 [Radiomyces spectabilis]